MPEITCLLANWLGNERAIGVNPKNERQALDLEFGSIIEPLLSPSIV